MLVLSGYYKSRKGKGGRMIPAKRGWRNASSFFRLDYGKFTDRKDGFKLLYPPGIWTNVKSYHLKNGIVLKGIQRNFTFNLGNFLNNYCGNVDFNKQLESFTDFTLDFDKIFIRQRILTPIIFTNKPKFHDFNCQLVGYIFKLEKFIKSAQFELKKISDYI